jgi:hypothetical protein
MGKNPCFGSHFAFVGCLAGPGEQPRASKCDAIRFQTSHTGFSPVVEEGAGRVLHLAPDRELAVVVLG